MNSILHGYQVNEPTWFYLSLLLILAVFFRFGRIFSLRNFDLALMLTIAPALLFAQEVPARGAFCLVAVTLGLLARTIFDSSFTRRPKLPQNMNPSGLTFLCVAAMAFLGTKVLTERPPANEVSEVQRAQQLVQGLDKKSPIQGCSTLWLQHRRNRTPGHRSMQHCTELGAWQLAPIWQLCWA
jgi:hypothetical protein